MEGFMAENDAAFDAKHGWALFDRASIRWNGAHSDADAAMPGRLGHRGRTEDTFADAEPVVQERNQ
jgi:hypothetical protein